jgi:hypothetical protein
VRALSQREENPVQKVFSRTMRSPL